MRGVFTICTAFGVGMVVGGCIWALAEAFVFSPLREETQLEIARMRSRSNRFSLN